MRHMSIGNKLFGGFGALFLALLVVGIGGWRSAGRLNDRVVELANVSGRAMQLAGEARYLASTLNARQRRVVILAAKGDMAGLQAESDALESDARTLIGRLDQIAGVSADGDLHAAALDARGVMTAWMTDAWPRTRRFATSGQTLDAVEASEQGRVALERAEALSATMVKLETDSFQANQSQAEAAYATMRRLSLVTLLIGALIAFAVAYLVHDIQKTLRASAGRLRAGQESVADASRRVLETAQTVSRASSQQAASLEETSASMEEMASMTRSNAEHAQQAVDLMAQAGQRTGQADRAIEGMVVSMDQIRESSNKVSKIIRTIDEIAFQTNILALNAAVEAARAGDAGLGFAVVADEVRRLAQRSAEAARNTAALIEESIAKSAEGADRVGDVSAAIRAITGSVDHVKDLVRLVSSASQEQAQGFSQVSQAVVQMEQMTQSNAEVAEESAHTSQAMNEQMAQTLEAVATLERLVGGVAVAETVSKANRVVPLATKPARAA